MKFITALIFTCLFALSATVAHAELIRFIENPLWFSKDTFVDGDIVHIYTALFNEETTYLTGVVEFYDRSVLIGKKPFTIKPRLVETVSLEWKVIPGEHVISASISGLTRIASQGIKEPLSAGTIMIEGQKVTVSPSTISAPDPKEPLPDTAAKVFDQVTDAQEKVSEALPEPVKGFIGKTTVKAEAFRKNMALSITTSRDALKSKLIDDQISERIEKSGDKALENYEASTAGTSYISEDPLKSPLEQLRLFFLNVGSMIFSNKFIFYGIIALLAFMIIRGVILMARSA